MSRFLHGLFIFIILTQEQNLAYTLYFDPFASIISLIPTIFLSPPHLSFSQVFMPVDMKDVQHSGFCWLSLWFNLPYLSSTCIFYKMEFRTKDLMTFELNIIWQNHSFHRWYKKPHMESQQETTILTVCRYYWCEFPSLGQGANWLVMECCLRKLMTIIED